MMVDSIKEKDAAAVSLGSRGGRARAIKLSPERKSEIARIAARVRWQKLKKPIKVTDIDVA